MAPFPRRRRPRASSPTNTCAWSIAIRSSRLLRTAKTDPLIAAGTVAKVLVIWFAAFVPSVINSYAGVRSLERHLIEAARTLGVSRSMMVREVLIPGAMPHIFTGLRLSLQACWTTLVAGELIGAAAGLGRVLSQGALDIFPAMILVGMVGVALAGGVMTWLLGRIEHWAIAWRP